MATTRRWSGSAGRTAINAHLATVSSTTSSTIAEIIKDPRIPSSAGNLQMEAASKIVKKSEQRTSRDRSSPPMARTTSTTCIETRGQTGRRATMRRTGQACTCRHSHPSGSRKETTRESCSGTRALTMRSSTASARSLGASTRSESWSASAGTAITSRSPAASLISATKKPLPRVRTRGPTGVRSNIQNSARPASRPKMMTRNSRGRACPMMTQKVPSSSASRSIISAS